MMTHFLVNVNRNMPFLYRKLGRIFRFRLLNLSLISLVSKKALSVARINGGGKIGVKWQKKEGNTIAFLPFSSSAATVHTDFNGHF